MKAFHLPRFGMLAILLVAGLAHGEVVQQNAYEYDAANQLTVKIDGTGKRTRLGYDSKGRLNSVIDPLNQERRYTFDELGRLATTVQPGGVTTRYGYDARDNVLTVTDPRQLVTQYQYDGFDRVIKQTSPDSGVRTATYTVDSQPAKLGDAQKQGVSYQYATGRLVKVSHTDGTAYTYVYGRTGSETDHLTGITDATGVRQFTFGYDMLGRRAVESRRLLNRDYEVRYGYDAKGLLNQLTYPSGRIVTYSYDAAGRAIGVQTTHGTASGVELLSNITYRPFGPVAAWTYGNGEMRSSSFDAAGRLKTLSLGDSTIALDYDDAGRLVKQQIAGGWWQRLLQRLGLSAGESSSYGYDALGRLTSWREGTQSRAYSYDANGNRSSLTVGAQVYAQELEATNNRLTSSAGPQAMSYQYDANGSRVVDGRKLYRYDVRGRLIAAAGAQYMVNLLGQRVGKTYLGATTLYHYDQSGRLLAETDAQGLTRREYVYLDALPVAVIDFGTEIRYIHTDHLGTPRLVTDGTKQAIWAWQGEPFGATAANEDPSGLNAPYAFNLRFPGQYYDRESGLHYNYFRDYDPQLGRYIQSDPIGLAGGINTYAYVGNDPLSRIDPLGLAEVIIWEPVGRGASSFGHVSVRANGRNYSWGTGGWDTNRDINRYIDNNRNFRTGQGVNIAMTPDQESRFEACLQKARGAYNIASNNCGTPAQECLREVGINDFYSTGETTLGVNNTHVLPVDLGIGLLKSSSVTSVTTYPVKNEPSVTDRLQRAPWAWGF